MLMTNYIAGAAGAEERIPLRRQKRTQQKFLRTHHITRIQEQAQNRLHEKSKKGKQPWFVFQL